MRNISSLIKTLSAAAILLSANAALATTYSNSIDGYVGGASIITPEGEVLNLSSGGTLTDFSFYAAYGFAGNVNLVVASWNGSQAVGPAFYTSPNFAYNGGAETLSFSGINTQLAAGSYIAFLTSTSSPSLSAVETLGSSNSAGGIGGGFYYTNTNGINPLLLNQAWTTLGGVPNLAYSATITAVPEPETYGMMMAGMGLMGFMVLRKKSA